MANPTRGRADHLDLGDWNAVCSLCGFKRKASTLVKNWQGFWRCPEHNEPRQPQDFVRGEQDIQTVPWAQPRTELYPQVCTLNTLSAVPGFAGPGCMVPGNRVTMNGFGGALTIVVTLTLPGIPTIVSVQ